MLRWVTFIALLLISGRIHTPLNAQIVRTVAGVLETPGDNDGPALSARFFNPHGLAVDDEGTIYIADRYNHTIRIISQGFVTTLAGTPGVNGYRDGTGAGALFNEPWGLCIGNDGNVYVADTRSNRIRKVTPEGVVTTVAGSGNYGTTDGFGLSATFGNPTGIEMDDNGNLYIADHLTHIIRRISPTGQVTTVAGTPYVPGDQDGTGRAARFWRPYGLTLDNNGDILVADEWNHKIRKVTPAGVVTTVAGNGARDYKNGRAGDASFNYPWDLTVDDAGIIYVMDGYNYVVRTIDALGSVQYYAGRPLTSGGVDGRFDFAAFSGATAIAYCKGTGTFFIADAYNHMIRELLPDAVVVNELNLAQVNGQSPYCEGTPISVTASPGAYESYQFYINGQLQQQGTTADFTVSNLTPGNYSFHATALTGNENIISDTLYIDVIANPKPTITLIGETELFEGDSVIMIADGLGRFLWSNGDTTQLITVKTPGTYFVDRTSFSGCTGRSNSVSVTVIETFSQPQISIDGNQFICPGETTILTSSYQQHNQWYRGNFPINGAIDQTLIVSEPGTYRVRVTDPRTELRYFSDSLLIVAAPKGNIDFTAEPLSGPPGTSIRFAVNGGTPDTYFWDFGDPLSLVRTSTQAQPRFTYLQPGDYDITLIVSTATGCLDTLTKTGYIRISKEESRDYFVPSAFTPNGDGLNDAFRVLGSFQTPASMRIFNQWGEQIFASGKITEGWDGSYKGLPAPSGTYTYLITLQNQGKESCITGHVSLIR